MYKKLMIGVAFVICSATALAQGIPTFADSLRTSLDRLFYPEQYVLDVQKVTSVPGTESAVALPGLSGGSSGGGDLPGLSLGSDTQVYNVLVILDSSISAERVRIAREVLQRQIESRGMAPRVTFNMKQERVLKVIPQELLEAKQHRSTDISEARTPEQVDSKNLQPSDRTNIYDFIENKRELAVRALIVLWSAMASLIALFAIIQRLLGGRRTREVQNVPTVTAVPQAANSGPFPAGKTSKTKDDIYSKDQALYQHIQDVVEQARQDPAKVAKVMERWIQSGADNVRYAAIFLKNCDIKTIENVSKNLHPADIQQIVGMEIDEFDPFSEENRRVLDEVRTQIALMASSHSIRERPDLFDFLKSVSDEDLLSVLNGESMDDIALITTQIPVHRMSGYIATLGPETIQDLMNRISSIHSPTVDDIAPLRKRLEQKIENLGGVLVTKTSRVQTLAQMISTVSLPDRQEEAAENLKSQFPDIYDLVRKGILLASDLEYFPARAQKVFLQQIDGEVLGTALSVTKTSKKNILENMPPAVREVFEDYVAREHDHENVSRAWKKVQDELRELMAAGLISSQEVHSAKTQAEDVRSRFKDDRPTEVRLHGAA